MIFGGDFQQILPVIPQGSQADTVNVCLFVHHIYGNTCMS